MVCLKCSVHPMRKQTNTKDTSKFSLLSFKIDAIRYNTLLTTSLQLPETIRKSPLWNRSQNGFDRSFMAFTSAKHATLMAAFMWGNRKKSAGDRSGSKEGDQPQLPSSEPEIGAHCVQGHYRGAASIFQSCATLAVPAGYAVAIGSKLPGKMRH